MTDDVTLYGFGVSQEMGNNKLKTLWNGIIFGGNPNDDGYDIGFDNEQEAKNKFLKDLSVFLSSHPNTVMYWRRLPVLICEHDFDLETVKFKYMGRIAYTNMENVK